jgi:hypothetical protein
LAGPDTYTVSRPTSFEHPLSIGSHGHRSILVTPPMAVAIGVQVRLPVPHHTRSRSPLCLHLRIPGFRFPTSANSAGCLGYRTASFDHFRLTRASSGTAQGRTSGSELVVPGIS